MRDVKWIIKKVDDVEYYDLHSIELGEIVIHCEPLDYINQIIMYLDNISKGKDGCDDTGCWNEARMIYNKLLKYRESYTQWIL